MSLVGAKESNSIAETGRSQTQFLRNPKAFVVERKKSTPCLVSWMCL